MRAANEQIRVSKSVKRKIERRRQEGESYNDVLKRLLDEETDGDFEDGFGRWSHETDEGVRDERRSS